MLLIWSRTANQDGLSSLFCVFGAACGSHRRVRSCRPESIVPLVYVWLKKLVLVLSLVRVLLL